MNDETLSGRRRRLLPSRGVGCFGVAATLALLALAAAPTESHAAPRDVDVLVLNFDPIVPGYNGQRVHSVLGWQNPTTLAAQYEQAVLETSGGEVNYNVVQWRDLDQIPTKVDGFAYTPAEYVQKWQSGGPWHDPDGSNYEQIMAQQAVPALIDSGTIDEVWMFGGPYFGFWESAMAGPRAFEINGPAYTNVQSSKPFAVMGFSYERELAEMLHNLGHRTEASVSRAFSGWDIENPQSDWDNFTANYAQTAAGPYGIGSVHYPANAESGYDYGNSRVVTSTAPDWEHYPDSTGVTEEISSAAWGSTHEGYMRYWLEHLPRADGVNTQTLRQNNWWEYVFNVDGYDQGGWPRGTPRPGPDGHYYLFVDDPGVLWQEALDDSATREYGGYEGHLVTITSQAEMDFVKDLSRGEIWIAGSDAAQEGTWRWAAGPEEGTIFYANGASVGFSGWGPGEPSGGNEDALHMLFGEYWNDVGATYPNNRGYVVEFSVLPGDFDVDGDVDGGDFLVWQRHVGEEGALVPGDGNRDGVVDGVDLQQWRENFGETAAGEGAGAAVPEVSGAALAGSLVGLVWAWSWRGRTQLGTAGRDAQARRERRG